MQEEEEEEEEEETNMDMRTGVRQIPGVLATGAAMAPGSGEEKAPREAGKPEQLHSAEESKYWKYCRSCSLAPRLPASYALAEKKHDAARCKGAAVITIDPRRRRYGVTSQLHDSRGAAVDGVDVFSAASDFHQPPGLDALLPKGIRFPRKSSVAHRTAVERFLS
ncbi:hypothetical protein EYF80_035275 [Liparis tanakae]|uniref:Uncharacterized protein n=1 Tax=Liparis tanakae TaxID=230148 RepID=A0A4Z2GMP6_9TELE|nr:hypothetical protein EYF80_035275 [Liparis tanakae]